MRRGLNRAFTVPFSLRLFHWLDQKLVFSGTVLLKETLFIAILRPDCSFSLLIAICFSVSWF